jgi:hypothetical protein
MSLSNLAEKKVNDKLFGAADFTPPANYYIGLLTAQPGEDGSCAEANYGAYARQAFANNKTNFANAADDGSATIKNNTEVRFPTATSGSNTITYVALFDALTGGNMYAYGILGTAKTYTTGDRPVFEVNSIVFTVD